MATQRVEASRSLLKQAAQDSGVLLPEKVYGLLKQEIITGVLKPGLSLTEAFLTERFSMSRTPVREACARLQNEGLLELVPNKGYFVLAISMTHVHELFQVRAILECAAAELACQSRTPQLILELESLGRDSYAQRDRKSYLKFLSSNRNFHLCIAQLTGNETLVAILARVLAQLDRLSYLTMNVDEYGPVVVGEHAGIVEAIKNANQKQAKKMVYEHIMKSKDRMLKAHLA